MREIPSGKPEPLFGIDAGFSMLLLPFSGLVQNTLTGLTLVTLPPVLFPYLLFEQAEKAMQQGDWVSFGKAMDALGRLFAGSSGTRR